MSRLHAVLASGMLTLALCDAGPTGYLPRAGPAPLRFGPKATDLPQPDWPPLLMQTPKREDPDATAAAAAVTHETDPGSQPPEITVATSLASGQDPYWSGPASASDGGWWQILITNQHGFLTVPAPRVDFVPPAVSTPASRAAYQTTP